MGYFDTLGLDDLATLEEVQKKYKKLALKYHPDKNPDDRQTAHEKMTELNVAYEALVEHFTSVYEPSSSMLLRSIYDDYLQRYENDRFLYFALERFNQADQDVDRLRTFFQQQPVQTGVRVLVQLFQRLRTDSSAWFKAKERSTKELMHRIRTLERVIKRMQYWLRGGKRGADWKFDPTQMSAYEMLLMQFLEPDFEIDFVVGECQWLRDPDKVHFDNCKTPPAQEDAASGSKPRMKSQSEPQPRPKPKPQPKPSTTTETETVFENFAKSPYHDIEARAEPVFEQFDDVFW